MNCVRDVWLSEVFGYDAFKVNVDKNEAIRPEDIFSTDSLPQRAFYYSKIPVTSVSQLGTLTSSGFRIVDVNVVFERTPSQTIDLDDSILVRDIQQGDEDSVLNIAETSFKYSRFHLDPCIPKQLADQIKRKWVANYIHGLRGERLLVAMVNGTPAGFLALLSTGDVEKTGVIDLIGVANDMQGRGIGRQLVAYHIRDAWQKYSRLIVGTQIANTPSIRLYQKCGYCIADSSYVLHAHIKEGKVI